MAAMADAERVHAETPAEWRAWLEAHHAQPGGVWLVSWKTATGHRQMSYEESVVEALAFGWIDSKVLTLDDERSMQWFGPRKKGSGWSRPNKRRIEMLEREGRLAPAGRAAVDRARADGSWSLFDAVEDLIVPDDLEAAFRERPGAAEHWAGFPASTKRAALAWIVLARTAPTRARRVADIAERAGRGERPR